MLGMIRQLWQRYEDRSIREALVDMIALNAKEQPVKDGIFGLTEDDEILQYLRPAVRRVDTQPRHKVIVNIGKRLAGLTQIERELLMTVAIIYDRFSETEDLSDLAQALRVKGGLTTLLKAAC